MTSLADNAKLPADEERLLRVLGQQLRADSIRCSTAAGSGHPTSAMSAADLMAVLLARHCTPPASWPPAGSRRG